MIHSLIERQPEAIPGRHSLDGMNTSILRLRDFIRLPYGSGCVWGAG